MKPERYSIKKIMEALPGTYGHESVVAAKVGCSVSTIQKKKAQSEELRDAFEIELAKKGDIVEDNLMQGAMERIKFHIECPECKHVISECPECGIQLPEEKMLTKAATSINIFLAKTLFKKRGYVERQELSFPYSKEQLEGMSVEELERVKRTGKL